jgi:16S rRNA pseudouridine516 synthase
LVLPEDLAPGQWRWLEAEQVDALRNARAGQPAYRVDR